MNRIAVTLAAVRVVLAASEFHKRVSELTTVTSATLTELALSELAARAVDLSEVDLAFAFQQGTRSLVVTVSRREKSRRRPEGNATL